MDELVPQWQKIADETKFEKQKLAKVEMIAQASLRTLVENKMKEYGWEYKLEKEEEKFTLAVKLQKKRMLKVSLPYENLGLVNKRLTELKTCVDAINNVPITVRISTYGNHDFV